MSTVVLITGANRGIGNGLISRYLATANHTVIAAVRNPEHPTSKALGDLPKADGSKLVVIKIDASVWKDAGEAVGTLAAHGVDHIDIVVAVAGAGTHPALVSEMTEDDMQLNMANNAHCVISLFQAVRPLLHKSKRQPEPIFAVMGSDCGTFGEPGNIPSASYGASKAVAHWLATKIDAEESWLNAFVLDPSLTDTDLAQQLFGFLENNPELVAVMKQTITSRDASCDGLYKTINSATKAHHGGKRVEYTGKLLQWTHPLAA